MAAPTAEAIAAERDNNLQAVGIVAAFATMFLGALIDMVSYHSDQSGIPATAEHTNNLSLIVMFVIVAAFGFATFMYATSGGPLVDRLVALSIVWACMAIIGWIDTCVPIPSGWFDLTFAANFLLAPVCVAFLQMILRPYPNSSEMR